MLFHKLPTGRSFGSLDAGEERDRAQVDVAHLGLALLFLAMLIVAAIVSWTLRWSEGATALLHLAEVAAGGLVGLFFGERMALGAARRAGR